MHRAVLCRLQAQPTVSLSRLQSRKDVSIVAAFRSGFQNPVWIAKTSKARSGMDRLRHESAALQFLQPWSSQFRIPAILDLEDTGQEVCLIQSGIGGNLKEITFELFPSRQPIPEAVILALDWLKNFREVIPAPQNGRKPLSCEELSGMIRGRSDLEAAAAALAATLVESQPKAALGLAPTHGDFWCNNVLFSRAGVGVIDWEVFGSGFIFDDIATFVWSVSYLCRGKPLDAVASSQNIFFSESSVAQYLKRALVDGGLRESELRYCFYSFLARRVLFDSEPTVDYWRRLLVWLQSRDFPEPFGTA
jgi:aminoglycoside phosphotransferase